MSMNEYYFFIEVFAPHGGLAGIEPHLAESGLPFKTRRSGFGGQLILLGDSDDIDFTMDPSLESTLYGSGCISRTMSESWHLLESLSLVLFRAGFPHSIGMDDNQTERSFWVEYEWAARH